MSELGRIERTRNRTLDDPDRVFEKNAWDDVTWDDSILREAETKVLLNSSSPLPEYTSNDFMVNSSQYWEEFYRKHNDQFFKDRKWLDSEFPEILVKDNQISIENGENSAKKMVVFETGCGVGNTVFPLLKSTKNTFVYCCDFSSEAIRLLKERDDYNPDRCEAFVADLTDENPDIWPMEPSSVDFIVMLFTLSAIRPTQMQLVINQLVSFLKPGGYILFRDYGKYDMAQLRFKKSQCAGDNLYIRQDGTLAYFFTQGLAEEQNAIDRRLLVNRKKNLLMHRVWIQCKFVKPL